MNKNNNIKILKFPNNPSLLERKVEAILFAAHEPLSVSTIQENLDTRASISKILNSLTEQYKNRGINLVCIANKWSFRTASNLSKTMQLQTYSKKKLSKAAIETLAIIVYHQPVTRSEIEEIRGVVFATGTLETLLELNWVRPSGRKNVPGKPIQYVTTDDFLSHFNLQKLSDLPNVEELTSAGLIDNANIDTSIFGTGKFYKEQLNEKKENIYSNIDDMLSKTLKKDDE
jgi:segregation and condensation protein B